MRENFRQHCGAECLHVVGFDVAVEKSKSSDHAAGLSMPLSWVGEKRLRSFT
jgi:hypothetical protein